MSFAWGSKLSHGNQIQNIDAKHYYYRLYVWVCMCLLLYTCLHGIAGIWISRLLLIQRNWTSVQIKYRHKKIIMNCTMDFSFWSCATNNFGKINCINLLYFVLNNCLIPSWFQRRSVYLTEAQFNSSVRRKSEVWSIVFF